MFFTGIITAAIGAMSSALKVVSSSLDFAAPILKALVEGFVWFIKKFKLALAVILSNLVVLYAIVPLMIGANMYGQKVAYKKCEPKVITKLRTQYKFIEKKPQSKKIAPGIDFTDPLSWWK